MQEPDVHQTAAKFAKLLTFTGNPATNNGRAVPRWGCPWQSPAQRDDAKSRQKSDRLVGADHVKHSRSPPLSELGSATRAALYPTARASG
jgi:hypothetical protein